ncbi:hypothetical protein HYPSUDRAFT_662153 [Hypholoma sublateritium FD-334 SS-4]|uniref:Uncharacterized protein n=1 Tax=Hypholoma sublateritium (strain FD-334 SS-4) TaxID=945553 RepID=A0A0D2NTV3_HYPSF|nr:hypothetical protein HYPSUDRAFT_662153 [Hypholoma sublateritium FD-334 SS-4]
MRYVHGGAGDTYLAQSELEPMFRCAMHGVLEISRIKVNIPECIMSKLLGCLLLCTRCHARASKSDALSSASSDTGSIDYNWSWASQKLRPPAGRCLHFLFGIKRSNPRPPEFCQSNMRYNSLCTRTPARREASSTFWPQLQYIYMKNNHQIPIIKI